MARRDARAAMSAVDQLTQRFPEFAPGWLSASALSLDLGRSAAALAAVERGLAIAPGDERLRVQRVRCLRALGRTAAALEAGAAAEAAVSVDPALQHELANTLTLLGDHGRALSLMRAAHLRLPNDAALNYNMATVLRALGEFAEAEALLDRAIQLAPQDWEAYNTRSLLRTQTPQNNHVGELKALLAPPPSNWSGEVQLRHALAKEYEDLGDHERSFVELRAGAGLRRRHLDYDVGDDVAMLERIAQVLDHDWLKAASPGVPTRGAMFVIGLPRSGTTLVERILSSHPQVQSLGELNDFPAAVTSVGRDVGGGSAIPKQRLLELVAAARPYDIGAAYLARIGAIGVASRDHFIDKLPSNYLYAGLIAAALPKARIIQVRRDPRACGYAMYKTLFNQGYPFSYDLDDLGLYIAAYQKLMAHWRDLLGSRLITVDYEALVADQEGRTRALLTACGLTWDPACLAPHKNPAPSTTQSAVQVRQPIYTHAVDQWRRYEEQLEPMLRHL